MVVYLKSTQSSMASNSNTNKGRGSHSHLSSSSSSLQDVSPYRHTYFSSQKHDSGQRDHMDANTILTPIWFAAAFAALFCLLCSRVLRTKTEEAAAGGNDGDNTAGQLRSNEAARGVVDGAPSSMVASSTTVQMAPLVCTYRKTDGWPEASCGVCLADLDDGDAVRVLPACMHYFHAACVGEWLRVHSTCPLCRAPLVAPTSAAFASTDARAKADPTSAPLLDGLHEPRARTLNTC